MKKIAVMQKVLRLPREECGSTLVEFAMSALILMAVTVSIMGFALWGYTYHFVSDAAQQGMRFAMVRGYTWSKDETVSCSTSAPPSFTMVYDCTASATDIQNYVQSLATEGINSSGVTIDTTNSYVWPGETPDSTTTGCSTNANSQGCLVKVTVNYSFKFFPSQHLPTFSITSTSEGSILQ